jgi:hypothetical protein
MPDFTPLLEFSHIHCVAICTFLVPANLLATLLTLTRVGAGSSFKQLQWTTAIANLFAGLMILHVLTWFWVGVVMVPTYVLMTLGCVCLSVNFWAIVHPQSQRYYLNQLRELLRIYLHKGEVL